MSASSDYLNVITRVQQEQGAAQAEAAWQNGALIGGVIGKVGDYIQQIPQQRAELARVKNQAAVTDLERQKLTLEQQQMQRAIEGQQTANQVIAGLPRKDDGTYDTGALMQKLAAGNVPLDAQEHLSSTLDKMNTVIASFNKSKVDHAADLANSILTAHGKDDPVTADAVHFGIAAAKATGLATDDDEAKFTQLIATGDPEQLLKQIRATSEKYKPSYEPVTEGGGALNKSTGEITTAPTPKKPKTKAELAADAANPQSPTADQSKAALKLLSSDTVSSAAEDERYRVIQAKPIAARTPDERAWAAAYEKQKTLGIDTSAAAAANRQTATIAAQTAQQARAQGFQESQAGRKELTDKVEQPYLDAQEKAATLRSVIAAAKNGNMEAANVQSLLAVLGLVTMEGVKRINTTELGEVSGAGSLLERIKGSVGSIVAGKPLSAKLQADLGELSQVLEQSARTKYESGFKAVTTRYGLKDEQPIANPNAAAAPVTGRVGPYTYTVVK